MKIESVSWGAALKLGIGVFFGMLIAAVVILPVMVMIFVSLAAGM